MWTQRIKGFISTVQYVWELLWQSPVRGVCAGTCSLIFVASRLALSADAVLGEMCCLDDAGPALR